MTRSPAQRSLDAESRAVEEGHRAFVEPDGSVLVVSDSTPGKTYRVTFTGLASGDGIAFTCTPEGYAAYRDDHLMVACSAGFCPCKHAALAARRLEREGLAYWDYGRWVVTAKAAEVTAFRLPEPPSDPFAGLPHA